MAAVLAWARAQLRDTGACEVSDFLTSSGLAAITADADELAAGAYWSDGVGTAYLEVPDFSLPEDHPRRILGKAAVGVVAYDMFPPGSPLRRLYEWDPFMRFIEAVLQRGTLYRYADALAHSIWRSWATATSRAALRTDRIVVSLVVRDADTGGDLRWRRDPQRQTKNYPRRPGGVGAARLRGADDPALLTSRGATAHVSPHRRRNHPLGRPARLRYQARHMQHRAAAAGALRAVAEEEDYRRDARLAEEDADEFEHGLPLRPSASSAVNFRIV
jgi:hypothetical protein